MTCDCIGGYYDIGVSICASKYLLKLRGCHTSCLTCSGE